MPGRRCSGLTLIEVLGGLTLLAVIAASLLTARADALRQHQAAQVRLDALVALDEQLHRWWHGDGVPVDASGKAADGRWFWKTERIDRDGAEALELDVLRVRWWPADNGDLGEPAASVELVTPRNSDAAASIAEESAG